VVLARASTAAIALRIPVAGFGAQDLAVAADGTIAWLAPSDPRGCAQAAYTQTVYVASFAEPTPRALTGPGAPCAFGSSPSSSHGAMAIAAGRVVYPAGESYAVTDPGGGAHLVSELPANSNGPGPIAFDGHTLYAVRTDCDAERLLAVDVDAAGPPPPAALQYGYPVSCPVAPAGSSRARLSPRGVTVRVSCPAGCRGTLRLTQEHRRNERLAGRREVSGRGTLTARVPLARYAAGLAGCGGGLRLRAYLDQTVYPAAQRTTRSIQWLGLVRVSAAGRCRRLAAPPFQFPLRYR